MEFETLTFKGHSTSSDDLLEHTGSARETSVHDTSAHDTSGHDTSGHDTSGHDTSGHDTADREARYAVIVSSIEYAIPEGASLITRQQWHDIKNHLGGLKLYATFLKKKTADGDDQAIVEKMLNGINGLIDHLAQIRGGDAK